MQSLKWAEVRLSERRERKGRKPIGAKGKTTALLVGVWVDLGLTSMCGVELCLPLVGALKSLVSWTVWSEEFWKCFEGKITPAIVLQVSGFYFTVNANVFHLTKISMRNQTHRRV